MIKIAITVASFLISLLTFSQNVGKSTQGDFNGKLCYIGRGLCNTMPPNTNDKPASMKNYTTYKQSENTMVIELDTNNLSLEDQKKFFGKEYSKISSNEVLTFVQEADFVFPIETLIYLGYNLSYRNLKKGEYPLAIIKDKILITLTLTKD